MRQLNAHDVVRICEWGRDKHPLDRALVLLRAASPSVEPMALARLPIGRRDALLLELRSRTFGPKLEVLVPCPKCGERLEMELTAEELRVPLPGDPRGLLELEGWALDYRLPDSNDLAALAHLKDPRVARARLLQRCVREARSDGQPTSITSVPEHVLSALAARMAEEDPQADITFRLDCPGCGHSWRAAFDILSFFWTELETQARQLQREVHELARVYGWTESTILSMSAVSRQRYLELVSSG
ncbi:phage baseplate protein [Vitiosangium sp. GDMCC 1.1324]|uniref:T4 family baseplate hub assembly chaperone n=1 Tax=Vitiosangium sp. (strain GDMCC 1.1324) TaxID=2138576 RepID=UPI000D334792|nr:phage baseplate protein [Vitiosangium sp. GDMCC 1.1324]PTL79513.1 phage baseplate protein [Vitiosangium sp. GDMCC 1.1324]